MKVFPRYFYLSTLIVLSSLIGCNRVQNSNFSKHSKGFYYHLIAFNSNLKKDNARFIALLDINYLNQNDSVFWNSRVDYDDKYFIFINPDVTDNFIETYLNYANEGDSVNLLIPKIDFFKQQFSTNKIPRFTAGDSVIKVNLKVKKLFNPSQVDSMVTDILPTYLVMFLTCTGGAGPGGILGHRGVPIQSPLEARTQAL